MKTTLPFNHLLQVLTEIDSSYELDSSEQEFFLGMKDHYGARAIDKVSSASTMIYYYLWDVYIEGDTNEFQRKHNEIDKSWTKNSQKRYF